MTTTEQFKILTDLEHIKLRPAMYIGSISKEPYDRFIFGKYQTVEFIPGLLKIIDEILDNSVDEAIRTDYKHANQISIEISNNNKQITISDNGRGIPQDLIKTPEGTEIPKPVAAWTRTKSGSNFDDTNRITQGMNGVGSALTNAYSSKFIGITRNGTNEVKVECTDGATHIDWSVKKSKAPSGTTVSFEPDFSRFKVECLSEVDKNIILDRIQTLSIIFPKILFLFNNKKIKLTFKKYAEQFGSDIVSYDSDKVSIAFAPSDTGFKQISYVNGLYTKNGGSHIEWLSDEISGELIPLIKRKFKLDITKARIKECLTLIFFIRNMPNLEFDSQTKERISNTWGQVKNFCQIDIPKLAKLLMSKNEIIDPIIELMLARKLAAEKAAATKAAKAAKKAKVPKHIAANGKRGSGTSLFLVEGDSAMNNFLSCRNQLTQGGFPLKGKVLTTWDKEPSKILSNAELFNICSVLNLTLTNKDISNRAYDYINIMTDADVDGSDIASGLICFFTNWPDLFEQGCIRIIRTPRWILTNQKDKSQLWFYTTNEYKEAAEKNKSFKNYEIRYIKGLGTLRKHEYEKTITDLVYYTIKLNSNWAEWLEMLYGKDADKRKDWIMDNITPEECPPKNNNILGAI